VSPKTSKSAATKMGASQTTLLQVLRNRFEAFPDRHFGLKWSQVEARLEACPEKLKALEAMEDSGGEPDVVAYDKKTGELTFFDCAAESPVGRRSLCYDGAALAARKENKPRSSAMDLASAMGVELLNEQEYRFLQSLGQFDAKTSSWIKTPVDIRTKGGALFCDFRFGHVFVYHNGAESYYAARGFRSVLKA
jgi:hypothetical protein